jgi:hypothetical protein
MRLKRLPLVSVQRPCPESWDSMKGSATARKCAECDRYVYNLSAMTRAEAERLLDHHGERLCIIFSRGPDGAVITRDRPPRFAIHPFAGISVAALATAMALSLPAGVDAGTVAGPGFGSQESSQTLTSKHQRGGLRGTIHDELGDVIDDASIRARNVKTGEEFNTRTSKDGSYRLALAKGRYKVEIEVPGFPLCSIDGVDVGSRVLRADATLHLPPLGEYTGFDPCGNPKLRKRR